MKKLTLSPLQKEHVIQILQDEGYKPAKNFTKGEKQYRIRSNQHKLVLEINDKEPIYAYAGILMELNDYLIIMSKRSEDAKRIALIEMQSEKEARQRIFKRYEDLKEDYATMQADLESLREGFRRILNKVKSELKLIRDKTSHWQGKKGDAVHMMTKAAERKILS